MSPAIHSSFILTYGDLPKSVNAGGVGSRAHWSRGYKEKKRWEQIWLQVLMENRVPKGMVRCEVAEARLVFRTQQRRDVENYRPAFTKPFADALVSGGYIRDDTEEFYTLGLVKLAHGIPSPSTSIWLNAWYE